MAVSDGLTPRKGSALSQWRGTPGRSPGGQVLVPSSGATGLFARTATPEPASSPAPPQRSQLLLPPVRSAAGAQPAGQRGAGDRSHAGRGDGRTGSNAAIRDQLQGGHTGGAFGIQPHTIGTPATAASLPGPRQLMRALSSSTAQGPPASPQAAAQQPSAVWSPMLAGGSARDSLAAQGAGLLRLAPAGSSAADVGWQVRRGALPVAGQAQPARAFSGSCTFLKRAAPGPQDALAVLAQLRRQLRQLEPRLSVAPPPLPGLGNASAPSTAADGQGADPQAPAAAAGPMQLPPRLASREAAQAALVQLLQHQQQAEQLQASTRTVPRAAAAGRPLDVGPGAKPAASPDRSKSGPASAEQPHMPEREPSAAPGGRMADVASQLQRLRLLQGEGGALAGYAAG